MEMLSSVFFVIVACCSNPTRLASATQQKSATHLHALNFQDAMDVLKAAGSVDPHDSYSVGYENENGEFRIESRDSRGNINGVYGYLGDDGKMKMIKYGAGNGIRSLGSSVRGPEASSRNHRNDDYMLEYVQKHPFSGFKDYDTLRPAFASAKFSNLFDGNTLGFTDNQKSSLGRRHISDDFKGKGSGQFEFGPEPYQFPEGSLLSKYASYPAARDLP